MGNTHDTEIARIEADHIKTKWRTTNDYRWGYVGDRGMERYWFTMTGIGIPHIQF